MTGLEIRLERIKKGIKQFELAGKIKVHPTRLSIIETGRSTATADELKAIRLELGLETEPAAASATTAADGGWWNEKSAA